MKKIPTLFEREFSDDHIVKIKPMSVITIDSRREG